MLHELLTGLLLLVATVPAIADDQVEAARAGQDAGAELLRETQLPGFVAGGERDQGILVIGTQPVPVNQIVPGGDLGVQDQLSAMAGDAARLDAAARARLAAQANDASDAAVVIRNVAAQPRRPPAEFLADESFLSAQSIRALTEPLAVAPEIPACTTEVSVIDGTAPYSIFRERTCEQVRRPESCERRLQLEDVSRSGLVVFDQHVPVPQVQQVVVPVGIHLPEGSVLLSADLSIEWTGDAHAVDWTERPSASNRWTGLLSIERTGGPCPACSTWIRIAGNIRAVMQRIRSEPEDCLLASDGFCSARFTCRQHAQPLVGGQPISMAESRLLAPIYPNDPDHVPPDASDPLCTDAIARYDCRINTGEFCIDTAQGPQCTVNTDDNIVADTCAPMLAREPDCALVHTACAEGGAGHGGWCYVRSSTYRCPESIAGPAPRVRVANPCSGQIRCAGDDCLDDRFDESGSVDVADGMAGMMVAQVLASDWAVPSRQAESREPALLPGRAYACRKALGGAIDCCDQTETEAERAWFATYQRHMRRANATASLARYAEQGDHGSWKTLAESAEFSLGQLDRPLTSGPETITGGQDGGPDPDPGSVVGTTTLLQPMNDEFVEQSRIDSMQEVGWACSAREFDLANQRELGHCLTIGSYCHASVAGACLDKRDVFCCFNSAASRLLRESIAGSGGVASGRFGTARHPRCDGITVAEARPEQVELQDLKGRIVAGGVVPDAGSLLTRTDADALTGSGSNLADGARQAVQQRTAWRMAQIDGSRVRDDLHEEADTNIPSLDAHASPGIVSFSPAFIATSRGRPAWISVIRQGSSGPATVGIDSLDGVLLPVAQQVQWADGQSGLRHLRIDLPPHATGIHELRLTVLDGDVHAYPNDRATISITAE